MGEYEVTPVVYKQLFLRTKRYSKSPVFIGPTMIHHRKNFDTFNVLASTCVSNSKGLADTKGYITGGEELVLAWKTELPKATHLQCIHHFEGNCKQKLRKIGNIQDAKSQKWFLNPIFGVPGRVMELWTWKAKPK